ncbi:MAG: hypothetical protein IJ848_01235 [Alphaproteobacteria bacterium]|nr:hypothetical protein [Alphaproteobacteria bacterium]
MYIFKVLSLIVISCTIFSKSNSTENTPIDSITIEHTPNLLHYIYCNGQRVLIEDAEEELSNNGLLKFTNGCIDVNSIVETNNGIQFNGCSNNKSCNIYFSNNSNIDNYTYTITLSKNQTIPLNFKVGHNITLNINYYGNNTLQVNTLTIDENATVNQCGIVSVRNVNFNKKC